MSISLTMTIKPQHGEERTDECCECECVSGGRGWWCQNLQALELQESDHQNQPVSTLCFLGLDSTGGAQDLPLPPGLFSFGGDWERGEGRAGFVCGWGWGGVAAGISGSFLLQAL